MEFVCEEKLILGTHKHRSRLHTRSMEWKRKMAVGYVSPPHTNTHCTAYWVLMLEARVRWKTHVQTRTTLSSCFPSLLGLVSAKYTSLFLQQPSAAPTFLRASPLVFVPGFSPWMQATKVQGRVKKEKETQVVVAAIIPFHHFFFIFLFSSCKKTRHTHKLIHTNTRSWVNANWKTAKGVKNTSMCETSEAMRKRGERKRERQRERRRIRVWDRGCIAHITSHTCQGATLFCCIRGPAKRGGFGFLPFFSFLISPHRGRERECVHEPPHFSHMRPHLLQVLVLWVSAGVLFFEMWLRPKHSKRSKIL